MPPKKKVVVFSGGSAANNLIDVFKTLCGVRRSLDFILPISDNGGSTSEIIRVCGGPGIGDVRSRLVRLVPEDPDRTAIKNLLNYRLPADNDRARLEWYSIVEGTHALWRGIPSEKRELLRSFFNHMNQELQKRQRPSSRFNFHSASIGNLFLTGARFFTGSFESSIYLFHSIASIPHNIQVIPAINSNHSHHIAAGLSDGTVIIGQNEISHPSIPASHLPPDDLSAFPSPAGSDAGERGEGVGEAEDANLPGSLASLRSQNIVFSKRPDGNEQLPARIERIWYINLYGEEIRPPANPKVVAALEMAEAVIYSIGSLYTSLAPCLVLRNVGRALTDMGKSTPKILLLNGSHDRETGPDHNESTATAFVKAVVRSCASSMGTMEEGVPWNSFVTHVIYLEGNGAPAVDSAGLKNMGIECMRVYGRKNPSGEGRGMLYDPTALTQTLEAILAARTKRTEVRRMTVDAYNPPNAERAR